MTHTSFDKVKICAWGQFLISKGHLSRASDVMNLLGYWGGDYAELIWQRISHQCPQEYLVTTLVLG